MEVAQMVREGAQMYSFPAEACGDRQVIKLSPDEIAQLVQETVLDVLYRAQE